MSNIDYIIVGNIEKDKSGWSKLTTNHNAIYSIAPDKNWNIEVGKTYEISYVVKKDKWGKDKLYIIKCMPGGPSADHEVKVPSNGQNQPKSGHSDIGIKEIADAKNKSIEVASIMKARAMGWEASSRMAEAVAHAFASSDAVKSWDWDKIEIQIRKVRQMEFDDFCTALKIEKEVMF